MSFPCLAQAAPNEICCLCHLACALTYLQAKFPLVSCLGWRATLRGVVTQGACTMSPPFWKICCSLLVILPSPSSRPSEPQAQSPGLEAPKSLAGRVLVSANQGHCREGPKAGGGDVWRWWETWVSSAWLRTASCKPRVHGRDPQGGSRSSCSPQLLRPRGRPGLPFQQLLPPEVPAEFSVFPAKPDQYPQHFLRARGHLLTVVRVSAVSDLITSTWR